MNAYNCGSYCGPSCGPYFEMVEWGRKCEFSTTLKFNRSFQTSLLVHADSCDKLKAIASWRL